MSLFAASAAAQTDINLPAPSRAGGLSVMETLWNRHSDREFSDRELSAQDLGDLCFAASGINRSEEAKLTAPSALNKQEVDLYVFTKEAVYKYVPQQHKLAFVAGADQRALMAGTPEFSQDFVMEAPLSLLLVTNPQVFDRDGDYSKMIAITDGGIMAENICIFCAGKGLVTVPRATMDRAGLAHLLSLDPASICVLNLPVGYPKD